MNWADSSSNYWGDFLNGQTFYMPTPPRQEPARPDHTQLPVQYADLNGVYCITGMAA